MATVNGKKDWQMRSATSSSELFTGAVIVSSSSMPLTFRRAMQALENKRKQEESAKTEKPEDEEK